MIKRAALAALATSLLCYPRLALWPTRALPIWYLEATLFLGGFVLWAFVFAWHTPYADRPVFTLKWSFPLFFTTTLLAIFTAVGLHLFADPALRLARPHDYPSSFEQWLAMTLFTLALTDLFLVFAPFAWLIRLSRNQWFAIVFTVLFGVVVFLLRNRSDPLAPGLFAGLLLLKIVAGFVNIFIYLRGGVVLVWWWTLVVQTRHWPALAGDTAAT